MNRDSTVNYVCVSTISQPVPILDGISEHEKYGNNGDKFDGISRSLVNGYEAFSNILNAFIQVSVSIQLNRCVCQFARRIAQDHHHNDHYRQH